MSIFYFYFLFLVDIEDKSKAIMCITNPMAEEKRLTSLVANSIYPKLVPNVEIVSWEMDFDEMRYKQIKGSKRREI